LVEVKTYTALCERSSDWWAVTVPEVRGIHTQAKRLDSVEAMVREAIGLMLDVPEDSFEVNVHWHLLPEADEAVVRLGKARKEVEDARRAFNDAGVRAALVLVRDMGLTVRDAGRILGVSHQRVDQLIHQA
jgi:predicted RNase H-like HicB family nuclease